MAVVRRLAHEPYGWRPRLHERALPVPRASSRGARYEPSGRSARQLACGGALGAHGVVVHHLTARIAQALGVSWKSHNTMSWPKESARSLTIRTRFEGVSHRRMNVWRHTLRQICHRHLDVTPSPATAKILPASGHGPAAQAGLQTWLASQPDTWRERIGISRYG